MKIDLHTHTKEISPCSGIRARDLVEEYKKAGYDGIVITDHFNKYVLEAFSGSKRARADHFLDGYRRAKEAGEEFGIEVFFGIESCIDGGKEDFLIYGAELKFVYEYPLIYQMSQENLYRACEEAGILLYQAHPFRGNSRPRKARAMHGVEVYNGNPNHDSYNERALFWARNHPWLYQSSGSDCHRRKGVGSGGIVTAKEVKTNQELIEALKARPELIQKI